MDRQMDGQTDRRTDGWMTESSITALKSKLIQINNKLDKLTGKHVELIIKLTKFNSKQS